MKFYTFLAVVLFALPSLALAVNPSVQSFSPSTTSINSGQIVSFTWRVADAGGYSFIIPCTQGIKIKKTDGTVFACDTSMSSVLTAVDGIDLIVWNLSGATKSFTARITPKDASGVDYSYGRQDVTVNVSPVAKPIETIMGTTTIASNSTYTLTWSSVILDGVNLSISCSSSIRTTSPSYTTGFIPCGTPIFATDLAGSGSLTLSFDNSAPTTNDIVLTILPAMAPGFYNGAGAESITVSVDTNIAPDPITTSFTASTTSERVLSNTPITLSWKTEKSTGANFRISCNDNVITTITTSTATSTPKCNTLAFDTSIPAIGTATISFENKNYANESIIITITPGKITGGFDATRGKELSFLVLPKGAVLTPATTQTTTVTPQTTIAPKTNTAKILFTKYLRRGSSNADVRALQTFLANDKTLYPEGVINGYFGPATERALKRLQVKHKVASAKTAGYGAVGPKTRALLNSLTN